MEKKIKKLITVVVILIILAALAIAFYSYIKEKEIKEEKKKVEKPIPAKPKPKYNWTVMVYTDMDNVQFGIFPTSLWGITWPVFESASYLMPSNIPVIVLFDGMTDGDSRLLSLSERKVLDDKGAVIPESREVNYGDPQTMTNFINWVTNEYPARQYLFVVCHHYGWEGYNPDESSPGALNMDMMTLPETKDALENAGIHMDVLWIEACSATQLENLYQYQPYFSYIVANEDAIDFMEMLLRPFVVLNQLAQNPEMTPKQVAVALTENYPLFTPTLLTNQFSALTYNLLPTAPSSRTPLYRVFPFALRNIWTPTQFTIDCEGIDKVKTAVDRLASFMKDNIKDFSGEIKSARRSVREYSLMPWYVDLYGFAERLYKNTDNERLKSLCQNVMDAVDGAVVAERKLSFDNYRGFLIQFPLTEKEYEREMYNEFDPTNTYWDLEFAKDTQWDEFLAVYFQKELPSYNPLPPRVPAITPLRNDQPLGGIIYILCQPITSILGPILSIIFSLFRPIIVPLYLCIARICILPHCACLP
jgi:hypothetical protein